MVNVSTLYLKILATTEKMLDLQPSSQSSFFKLHTPSKRMARNTPQAHTHTKMRVNARTMVSWIEELDKDAI